MTDEIFDIVNEQDVVIGRQPRPVVHRDGLRHRATHIFVFNARGEIFLQKRSMSKDTHPGTWDSSASGHVDCGENYDDCAVRELMEEIGLKTEEALQPLFKIAACPETGQEFVWVYQCSSEGPFVLNAEEIETGAWFFPEKVSEWVKNSPGDFSPAFVLIWNRWIELQASRKPVPAKEKTKSNT